MDRSAGWPIDAAMCRRRDPYELSQLQRGAERSLLTRYLADLSTMKDRTPPEEPASATTPGCADPAARTRLVEANLGLVVAAARRRSRYSGADTLDLIQEGNLALIAAACAYDPLRGVPFPSFAAFHVRRRVAAASGVPLPIQLSASARRILRRADHTNRRLAQEMGREPTHVELAQRAEISPELVASLRLATARTVALDAPLGDSMGPSPHEQPADETLSSMESLLDDRRVSAAVAEMVAQLPSAEANIVHLCYGLASKEALSIDECGDLLGLTRNQVRVRMRKALRRLRRIAMLQGLSPGSDVLFSLNPRAGKEANSADRPTTRAAVTSETGRSRHGRYGYR